MGERCRRKLDMTCNARILNKTLLKYEFTRQVNILAGARSTCFYYLTFNVRIMYEST